MKKLFLLLAFALGTFAMQEANAQADPTFNMTAIEASIPIGGTGHIAVTLCNVGATAIAANKLRPQISLPASGAVLQISGVTASDGSPLQNFTIQSQTTTVIRLLYTATLDPGACLTFYVTVVGISQSPGLGEGITGNILYAGPAPFGNQTGNDGGNTTLLVYDPLPVTLVSFTAVKEGNTANLNWATTMETNADHYEIQRSAEAKNWANIGEVAAAGESKALLNYSFIDRTPLKGANFYRLKMIDKDNTFAYSRIRELKFENGQGKIAFYPNPATSVLYLKDDAGVAVPLQDIKEVSILNMNGNSVYKSNSLSALGINVGSLTSGMYLVQVTRKDGAISTHKVVISK